MTALCRQSAGLRFDAWNLYVLPGGPIARQYDDNSRRLVVAGDLPEGWAWSMLVRAGGCAQYLNIISLGPVDGGVGVTLTADMVPISGYYTMQLRGTNGDQTRHTNAVVVTIPASLSGDAQWPEVPSEFSQIEANIIALNQHPPIPGDEGYWLTWDLSTGAYVTSDLPLPDVAVGPPGPPGEAATVTVGSTTTGEPGTQAQVTNSGTESAAVLNFVVPRGATGATPQIQVRVTQLPEGAEPTVKVTGTAEAPVITLGIPAGATGGQGPQGPAGQTPTITIGQVETLPPGSPVTASITGQTPNLVLNLGIPQGAQGTPGEAATIEVTETQTVPAGTPASFEEVEGSTAQARKYVAKVPQGAGGPQGPAGLGVPAPTAEDAGKVPTVNEAGDGYELLPPSGGDVREWSLLGTVDCSEASGPIDFTDLDDYTEIFVQCALVKNANATASGYTLRINDIDIAQAFAYIGSQQTQDAYCWGYARYNGLVWIPVRGAPVAFNGNVALSNNNVNMPYNLIQNVGTAAKIRLTPPATQYQAVSGTITIWGR